MSNSTLVCYTKISPNKKVGRTHAIDTITIHCVVGQCSVETIGDVFFPVARKASSNYGIGPDGRVGMYVEEKDRSWCSSNTANDDRSITIECASDTTSPYAINDAVYNSLIELCADICCRNGIKELKWKADKSLIGQPALQNMTVHRWFSTKSCPGDYIYARLGDIASKVNSRLGATVPPVTVVHWASARVLKLTDPRMKGDDVKGLQSALTAHGFPCGTIDGDFGDKTDLAVKHFQASRSLIVDGKAGEDTVNALDGLWEISAVTPTPITWTCSRVLKLTNPYMKGADIIHLQEALNSHNCPCGTADGTFGEKTDMAVRTFQAGCKLTADGKAGHDTITALGGTWTA